MQSLYSYLMIRFPEKVFSLEQHMNPFNNSDDILFANSGSTKRNHASKEIRDESGLGSGAGVTPEDQARFNRQSARPEMDSDSVSDDEGATGPGGDRSGDTMAGEEGVTDVTDGIARFIDDLEDDSENGKRKK